MNFSSAFASFLFGPMLANTFAEDLMQVVTWIFLVVATLIVPLAIWLGFKLAKAGDPNKRREAKKHMINAVASLIIILILIGAMQIPALWANIGDGGGGGGGGSGGGGGGSGAGWTMHPNVMQTGTSHALTLTHGGVVITDATFTVVSGGGSISGNVFTAGSTESVAVISVSVPGQRVPNQQIVITRNEVNIPPPPGGGGVGGGGGASTPRPDMEGFDDWVRPAGGTVGGMGWINGRWHMGSDFYGSNGTVFNAVAPGTVMRIHRYASTGDRHRLVIMHEGHFVVGDRVYNRIWTAYQVYTGGVIFQNIQPGMQVTTTTNLGQVGAGLPLHFEVRTTGPTTADNQTGNILATAADTSTAPVIDPRWIFS